jgi:hypothetical protein
LDSISLIFLRGKLSTAYFQHTKLVVILDNAKIFSMMVKLVAKKTALPCSYKFAPLFPNDSVEGPLLRDLYEDKLVEIR